MRSIPFPAVAVVLALLGVGIIAIEIGSRQPASPRERIIVHPSYAWEDRCRGCGRREGDDGVKDHYCRHCGRSFVLRAIPDPY